MLKRSLLALCMVGAVAAAASAQVWNNVSFVDHSVYQEVNADGSSAYSGGFPVRMIGVVLSNTEDWLDPTPAYDPGVHLWQLGGEAEFSVQATDLDGTPWDTDPGAAFDDFGGTSCWMGQNYGNHIMRQDPSFSYTDAEWTAELGRLNLFGGDGVTDPLRAGDLVEIRARAGLPYKGKMNVNELHTNDPAMDFEIVVLQEGYGLPAPTPISLSDLKTAGDAFIFDPTRQAGGERYQGEMVQLMDVRVASTQTWTTESLVAVTDGVRTFTVRLGANGSFDGTELFGVGERFNVVGIMNQADSSGQGGYQLLAMSPADFTPVPEPTAAVIMGLGALVALRRRRGER
jgi:hypothetical protein